MNRVWVYQSNRFLTIEETVSIQGDLENFVSAWTAHGSALSAKASIKDNLFLILEVDESQAGVTGCSIDKSVHFLKSLGEKYSLDFFDRMKVSFIANDNTIRLVNRNEFEKLIKSGDVSADTIVFNNLVQNSDELTNSWKLPFKDSWHSKVF